MPLTAELHHVKFLCSTQKGKGRGMGMYTRNLKKVKKDIHLSWSECYFGQYLRLYKVAVS